MFSLVIIVGVGLLGGSIGLAVKRRSPTTLVVGVDLYRHRLEAARTAGCIDDFCLSNGLDFSQFATRDGGTPPLVVVCAPVSQIPPIVQSIAADSECPLYLTDVGSTKTAICRALVNLPNGSQFVGSHPIAGSEKSGHEHSTAELFVGKRTIVTPLAETDSVLVATVQDFWQSLGSEVSFMLPEEHDTVLARTSHLPHALSVLLAATVASGDIPYCGTGYHSMARLAHGDVTMWRDIFHANRSSLLAALAQFRLHWDELETVLRDGSPEKIQSFLAQI